MSNAAPFGTDVNGTPLNDPIPDTLVDPMTGNVVTPLATGTSALLDKFVVTKPDLSELVSVHLSAPHSVAAGGQLTYTLNIHNGSPQGLTATPAASELPTTLTFVASPAA